MKNSDNVIVFLDAMLGAASYQMCDEELSALYDELIKRFKNYNTKFSDYGNLIYGALIMAFGDYGTSPRTGWFDQPVIAVKCADYITDLKRHKEELS